MLYEAVPPPSEPPVLQVQGLQGRQRSEHRGHQVEADRWLPGEQAAKVQVAEGGPAPAGGYWRYSTTFIQPVYLGEGFND